MLDSTDDLNRIVAQLNNTSSARRGKQTSERKSAIARELLDLLSLARNHNASDVLLIAGSPPVLRKTGVLTRIDQYSLSAEDVQSLVLPLLSEMQYKTLRRKKMVDVAFGTPALGRFRANIHYQRGTLAASIRLFPRTVPTVDSLHLPPSIRSIAALRQGLVLVTGPTGAGKSSTLAAIINEINSSRECHIVTLEDPVEYVHENRAALIEQIEVGLDTPNFVTTLRGILRQSPDVILIGEMRDSETIVTALRAAETGHLVLSTLHTNDSVQAVSRILDVVATANQSQVRLQLSLSLSIVIAQQLVPTAEAGGRHPALEILTATDAIRNLIRQGLDHQIRSQMLISRHAGSVTMEHSLAMLVRSGIVQADVALAHCSHPDELRGLLG